MTFEDFLYLWYGLAITLALPFLLVVAALAIVQHYAHRAEERTRRVRRHRRPA